MLYYPEDHWIFKADAGELTRFYLAELNEAMYAGENIGSAGPAGSIPEGKPAPGEFGIPGDKAFPGGQSAGKAGQIKTALEAGTLDRQSQKLFSAAADAARESGCAMMVHVEQDADPAASADYLLKQGLAPSRLIFCHLDRAIGDLGVHKELCRRGAYLEYDTIGRPKYHDDEQEAKIILEMAEAGFAGQLLMSLDTTRARLRAYGGNPGRCHILESFIPLLKNRGFTEEHIRMFFVKNPARVFTRTTVVPNSK
jgi:phosphotriesterase-related protein